MASLPSFVELMASLGLATETENAGRDHTRSPDSSSSQASSPPSLSVPMPLYQRSSSPSIVVSNHDLSFRDAEPRRRGSSGSIRAARFAPYSPTLRRGSVPTMSDPINEERPARPHSSAQSQRRASHPEQEHISGNPSEQGSTPDVASYTPISTFVRRRSPQGSPTSTSFPHRTRNTCEAPVPVLLPTLPPLLSQSFASFSFLPVSSDTSDTDVDAVAPGMSPVIGFRTSSKAEITVPVRHHHYQAGVRISSPYRSCAHQSVMGSQRVSPIA